MELETLIDQYSEELYSDLGMASMTEERKAELYARLQEHLHAVVPRFLRDKLGEQEVSAIETYLEQENYEKLRDILKNYPDHRQALEDRIKEEYSRLKKLIEEENANQ